MVQVTKITNVSSSNYEVNSERASNPKSVIRYIVVGMTNDLHSGYAYARSYKNPLVAPKITYNYVIDKKGSIYQTISDDLVPFTVKSSSDEERSENVDVLSICMMPEWEGESAYDDSYDRDSNFPEQPYEDQYFILLKNRTINGVLYKIGLYKYINEVWVLLEELLESSVKRPFASENWAFDGAVEDSCINFIKWLQVKYEISDARILRVFDFNKMYNPSPYVYEEGEQWKNFKERLQAAEVTDQYIIIPEASVTVDGDITGINPKMSTEEIIEMYGPDAEPKENKLKGNSIGEAQTPQEDFTFEIGIHNQKDTLWHLNETVNKCSWTSYIDGGVGEFNFVFRNQENEIDIQEGYNVGYWINGFAGFNGNIFRISQKLSDKELLDVKCSSFIRYLQNKGWANMQNKTASQIFDEVCTQVNVPHRVIDASSHICKGKNYFADTWYKPIEDAIIDTLANTGEYYIIQENFGTLEFRNIMNIDNVKNIKFSEDSCIIDGAFESDIENSYNYIIGYIKGKADKNADGSSKEITIAAIAGAKDESTIQQWGMLTEVEEVPENNIAPLQNYINQRLKFYNSPRRRFTLSCIGVPGIIAGNIIWLEITNVVGVGNVGGGVIVDKCTHNIENSKHTMELELEIVQNGTVQANIYDIIKKMGKENEQS